VQRPGVAANEQPAALDERAQLSEVELAKLDDPIRLGTQLRPGRGGDAIRRLGPELRMIRRFGDAAASPATSLENDGSGQRRNGFPALTWATTSSCAEVMPAASSRRAIRASASASRAISTLSRVASGPPEDHPSIASSRSHWFTTECRFRSSRGRGTAVVYIHVRPGMT
jgi:hypothetical protein